jgi:hypothetical protein
MKKLCANNPPTPRKFAAEMRAIFNGCYDPEANHRRAEDKIVGLLRQLGYGKAAEIFEATDKWYS